MAQLKIAPHLLLEALFGGCAGAEGLTLENASFDLAGDCVVLDLRGPGLPAAGAVVAKITTERKKVEFVPALQARAEPVTVGMDIASGPDHSAFAKRVSGEWIEVGTLTEGGWNPRQPLPTFDRQQAMEDVAKAFGIPASMLGTTEDDGFVDTGVRIPLQRLEVKDTMKAEYANLARSCKAFGLDHDVWLDEHPGRDETRPALSPLARTACPELTQPQAPWPFGNAKPVSQESTDPSMPITMVEPEDTNPAAIQAQPHVAGNLLKVR